MLGHRWSSRFLSGDSTQRGFGALELAVMGLVLTVLTAVVVPHAVGSAQASQGRQLRGQLALLRQALLRFRAEHWGQFPGQGQDPGADQARQALLERALCRLPDPNGPVPGAVGQVRRREPYLTAIPVNPFNGSAAVRTVGPGQLPPAAAEGPCGWIYQPATGVILANVAGADAAGVEYLHY